VAVAIDNFGVEKDREIREAVAKALEKAASEDGRGQARNELDSKLETAEGLASDLQKKLDKYERERVGAVRELEEAREKEEDRAQAGRKAKADLERLRRANSRLTKSLTSQGTEITRLNEELDGVTKKATSATATVARMEKSNKAHVRAAGKARGKLQATARQLEEARERILDLEAAQDKMAIAGDKREQEWKIFQEELNRKLVTSDKALQSLPAQFEEIQAELEVGEASVGGTCFFFFMCVCVCSFFFCFFFPLFPFPHGILSSLGRTFTLLCRTFTLLCPT
jgi:chromosome segregation ATPase